MLKAPPAAFSHRARLQRARARLSLALRCGLAGQRLWTSWWEKGCIERGWRVSRL